LSRLKTLPEGLSSYKLRQSPSGSPPGRIFVTEEGFDATKATLPLGSVAFEPEITKGLRSIWVEPAVVDRLTRECRPGETFSHVIMRLAKEQ
jgi:hypothetical protein